MKKLLKLLCLVAINYLLLHVALASTPTLPIGDLEIYRQGGVVTPPPDQEAFITIESVIFGTLAYLKPLVAVIGILYLTIAGYRLVINGAEEDQVSTAKSTITYTIIAFVIISMSQDFAKIFDMSNGTILESPQKILSRVQLFDRQVELIITFVKYVIGAGATLMLVRSGAKMVAQGGSEEVVTEERQSIIYIVAALLMITIGEVFIDRVLYRVDKTVYTGISGVHPQLGVKEGIQELAGITNLAITIVGPLLLLVLIGAAFLYSTANGQEDQMERAKRMIIAAAVGIVMIYAAFAIVSTIVAGRLADINAIAT